MDMIKELAFGVVTGLIVYYSVKGITKEYDTRKRRADELGLNFDSEQERMIWEQESDFYIN